MDPAAARTLERLHAAHLAGDLDMLAACYAPEAVLRAPFLSEPLRGWRAIEAHLATTVFPYFHGMQILATREAEGGVLRSWQARIRGKDGGDMEIEGTSHYRFDALGRVTDVVFHLDDANLRLLVLRRD